MSSPNDERPLAYPSREEDARRMFLGLTPEEYAARWSHTILCFSFDNYSYRDPKLDAWIQEFAAIMRTPGRVDECRQKYLSPEEMAAIASDSGL